MVEVDADRSRRPALGLERDHQGEQAPRVTLRRGSAGFVAARARRQPGAVGAARLRPSAGTSNLHAAGHDARRMAGRAARRAVASMQICLHDRVACAGGAIPRSRPPDAVAAADAHSAARIRSARQRRAACRCDPGRAIWPDGYLPIDWTLDPVSGLRFPAGFRTPNGTPPMRPGLADIKLPWELGRCQHWVALGQAFRLTGDEAIRPRDRPAARGLPRGQPGRRRRAVTSARWTSRSAHSTGLWRSS